MVRCNETVTLVHHTPEQEDDRYTSTVIRGVSWFGKSKSALQGNGLATVKEVKVRIPAESLSGDTVLRKGDYLVRGELTMEITKPTDLSVYEFFQILVIGDNRRGKLPHWAVGGA